MTQLKSMQRIFMFLYSLFACMLIMNPLVAIALQDKQDVKNDLRILELLPNLLCPLAVDPGIPADFVALSPNGILDLHNCLITSTAIVNGSLNADNTKFQNALSVASQKIVLRMCSVDSLTIRKVSGCTGKQVVDLRSGTNVTGPIVVESGNGEIWISSNSEISETQVSGAQVYRK